MGKEGLQGREDLPRQKQNFTAVAAITAAYERLPIQLIAKGTTKRTEKNFGPVGDNIMAHTTSGWSTLDSFCAFVTWLRNYGDYGEKVGGQYRQLTLVLDIYKVHKAERVKRLAESLNIKLIFIPPGMTDACQPLDRTIFGVLKMKAKKIFRIEFAEEQSVSKMKACELLQKCWNEISLAALRRSWAIYDPENDH
jgi:hypothetical protein